MFPHLALATSAEWTTFILSSVLLWKRTLSCNINGCPRRAKCFIHIVLSELSNMLITAALCFVFRDKRCEQNTVNWLQLGQIK